MSLTERDKAFLQWCVEGSKLFQKCLKRQYMTIITDQYGRVIGTGYNGAPAGLTECTDGGCPRMQEQSAPGSSYDNCIAIHSEQHAILYSDFNARRGGTLYVNGPPCFTCAKLIAGSGIKKVVCLSDDGYADWPKCLDLMQRAGITVYPI